MSRVAPLVLAIAAAATLSACAQSTPHYAARSPAPPSARALADCSKLRASALPVAALDQLMIREASRLAGAGSASPALVRQAKAAVVAELRSACPRFVSMARQWKQ